MALNTQPNLFEPASATFVPSRPATIFEALIETHRELSDEQARWSTPA